MRKKIRVFLVTILYLTSFYNISVNAGIGYLLWPVPSSSGLSSCYEDGRNHGAIDITGNQGVDVIATGNGVVIETRSDQNNANTGYGNYIKIQHDNLINGKTVVTKYNHLNTVEVTTNQRVTAGQRIGGIGSTGYSFGNHLDFQVFLDGINSDPGLYIQIPIGLYHSGTSPSCCQPYIDNLISTYQGSYNYYLSPTMIYPTSGTTNIPYSYPIIKWKDTGAETYHLMIRAAKTYGFNYNENFNPNDASTLVSGDNLWLTPNSTTNCTSDGATVSYHLTNMLSPDWVYSFWVEDSNGKDSGGSTLAATSAAPTMSANKSALLVGETQSYNVDATFNKYWLKIFDSNENIVFSSGFVSSSKITSTFQYSLVGTYTAFATVYNDNGGVRTTQITTTVIPNTFNAIFNCNNGNLDIESKMVTYNSSYGTLPIPELEGYTFDGWYLENTFINKVTENTLVTAESDHTLYAKWLKQHSVKIKYNNDTADDIFAVADGEIINNIKIPEKDGYIFDGYYTDSGMKWNLDSQAITSDVTLSAKWIYSPIIISDVSLNQDTNKISFVANGNQRSAISDAIAYIATYTDEGKLSDVVKSPLTELATGDSQIKNITLGSLDNACKYKIYIWNEKMKPLSIVTERGIKQNVVITFDSQGGNSISPIDVKKGSLINQPTSPSINGYVFKGWFKEKSCINAWNFENDIANDDITLYAKWELTIKDGIYQITNASSGLYMNVSNGVDTNGTNVNIANYKGWISQLFRVSHIGNGKYHIFAMCSSKGNDKVLDLNAGGINLGISNVSVVSNQNQDFYINAKENGNYVITHMNNTSNVIAAEGNSNGSNVTLQNDTNTTLQQWNFLASSEPYSRVGKVAMDSGNLKLRCGPTRDYSEIALMPNGTSLTVYGDEFFTYDQGETKGWFYVYYPATGQYGYASADYVSVY